MLNKKIFAVLAAVVLLVSLFSGCGSGGRMLYGDKISKDTLVICVDSWAADPARHMDQEYENKKFFTALADDIKRACGIEKVVFEILPQNGAERETRLQRLRTEIMSGEGPDLFLMQTVVPASENTGFPIKHALFKFPEKNMEAGIFLPLDEYMENNTQFTDWSRQTKVVLEAGRNDEGQQIIPLTYTFPVMVYPRSEMHLPYTTDITPQDILDNPETLDLGAALYSDERRSDELGSRPTDSGGLCRMLGKYADYETEELLFTEEDIYESIQLMASLRDKVEESDLPYETYDASYLDLIWDVHRQRADFGTDMTLVPTYSIDGGVTARITAFAAVNRNTKKAEEAFSVIDYLMQERMQCESEFFSEYFNSGLPLQNDLGSEEKMLGRNINPQRFLMEPYYSELLAIKEQITAVNFESELDGVLGALLFDYRFACLVAGEEPGTVPREEISAAYDKMERMMGE